MYIHTYVYIYIYTHIYKNGKYRDMRIVICWMMRALFICGGFHHLKVKGRRAESKDAPVLALAPHSSFFDALPVVYLGGPSIVAKAEIGRIPFFGSRFFFSSQIYALSLSFSFSRSDRWESLFRHVVSGFYRIHRIIYSLVAWFFSFFFFRNFVLLYFLLEDFT